MKEEDPDSLGLRRKIKKKMDIFRLLRGLFLVREPVRKPPDLTHPFFERKTDFAVIDKFIFCINPANQT